MASTAGISAATPRRMRLLADAALLGIAAVWGATFFMVKDATSSFPVLAFLVIRFILASLALLPFALRVRRWPSRQEWKWGLIAGIAFGGGYIFQTFALRMIDAGRTGFITGLYVVLVPILALVLLRHAITIRVVVGTVLALVGLTLLSYAPGGNFVGDLLAFLCALSYALQILAVEKFPKDADWRIMSLIQSGCVAVICGVLLPVLVAVRACQSPVCTPFVLFADPLPTTLPLMVLAVAAFTGLLATAVGLAAQVWAQRILPPSDAALIYAMEAPFSALFGWIFRGEVLTQGGLFGCGLIMAGMLSTALGGESKVKPEAETKEGLPPALACNPVVEE
jgi:drug/metabolite transporter (DMT)-like permease